MKVHTRAESFEKELAVYLRLQDQGVIDIQGFAVPRLVGFDSKLLVVEMSIVKPPFLLDFAQTTLDQPPDFDMEEYWERVRERFEDRFQLVESVFWELVHKHGVYYWDLKPGNIEFGDKF